MKRSVWVIAMVLLVGPFFPAPVMGEEKKGLDGAALVRDRCTACHSTDRIFKTQKDKKGWEQNVDRMIAKGAKLSGQEREAIVASLSNR